MRCSRLVRSIWEGQEGQEGLGSPWSRHRFGRAQDGGAILLTVSDSEHRTQEYRSVYGVSEQEPEVRSRAKSDEVSPTLAWVYSA